MGIEKLLYQTRKISCGLLSSVLIISSVAMYPIKAMAASDAVQTQLNTLTISLKHILNAKYDALVEEIKEQIVDNEWDYYLTTENLTGYNFKDVDYVNMLAAYMTAKEYCRNNGSSFIYFEDLPLISYTIEEKYEELKVPKKVTEYILAEDGDGYIEHGSYYVSEDKRIPAYSQREDGRYEQSGYEDIILETKKVKYAEPHFNVMTAEILLDEYELPEDEFTKYKDRIDRFTKTTNSKLIYQSIFAKVPDTYTYEGNTQLLNESYQRRLIVSTAATLIGMIPYQWGGKPTKPGYDTSWWQFDDNNEQKGLDCSGFVQWAFMTAGYPQSIYQKITTVASISSVFPEVNYEELRPGDVGCWYGPVTNHVGIYAGNGKWIHCTGGDKRTVVVDDFGFTNYYRLIGTEDEEYEIDQNITDKINSLVYAQTDSLTGYSNEDLYLLASLVQHEAGSEGLNGWIGVAEVVKNRVKSELFPNSIPEVIFQPGQFTTADELSGTPPSEEIIKTTELVLEGKMAILNNPLAMYFKNPMITDNIPSTEPVDWGNYKYYMAIGRHAFYEQ